MGFFFLCSPVCVKFDVTPQIGGATAMIGDPSGRNTERPVLDKSSVFENCRKISDNISTVFANHEKYFWDDKNGKEKLASLK